jgi:TM2 domain-containing membrane protein YozV
MTCPQCGFSNHANVVRCQKCGAGLPVAQQPAPPAQPAQPAQPPQQQFAQPTQQQFPAPPTIPPKSKAVAALLCWFLGIFGAHNFYLGRTACAVIQLIISLSCFGLYVIWIWVLIDFILIICGSLKDSNNRPLV